MFTLLAQRGGAGGGNPDAAGALGGMMACCGVSGLVVFAVLLISVVGAWKVFTKAGQPGWAAIVPIYNTYVLVVEIAKKDMTWFLLSIFVPFAVIVPLMDAAEKYGKSRAYGIGLLLLPFIFWPMLGFGDAEYQGGRSRRGGYDLDDEDEDDRPRRKSRRDDYDDEDEDERPRKKKRRADDYDDE